MNWVVVSCMTKVRLILWQPSSHPNSTWVHTPFQIPNLHNEKCAVFAPASDINQPAFDTIRDVIPTKYLSCKNDGWKCTNKNQTFQSFDLLYRWLKLKITVSSITLSLCYRTASHCLRRMLLYIWISILIRYATEAGHKRWKLQFYKKIQFNSIKGQKIWGIHDIIDLKSLRLN